MNLCWATRRELIKRATGKYDPRVWDYAFASMNSLYPNCSGYFMRLVDPSDGVYWEPYISSYKKYLIFVSKDFLEDLINGSPALKSKQVLESILGRNDSGGKLRVPRRRGRP